MTVISAVMYSLYSFDPEAYLLLSHAPDLMAGLGNGLAICTVPVLIAETSPAKIRKLISALFWCMFYFPSFTWVIQKLILSSSMSSGQMMILCLGIEVASPLLAQHSTSYPRLLRSSLSLGHVNRLSGTCMADKWIALLSRIVIYEAELIFWLVGNCIKATSYAWMVMCPM